MIIVSTEITVESIADAIVQLQDYQLGELASYLVLSDARQATTLERVINAKIKEL